MQRPAYYDELSGQFFFNPPGAEAPAPAPQAAVPQLPPPSQKPSVNEREAFAAAKEIGTDAAWDAFLTRFSEGFYADMARAAREKLARGTESDSIPPSVEPATPSPLGGEFLKPIWSSTPIALAATIGTSTLPLPIHGSARRNARRKRRASPGLMLCLACRPLMRAAG